MQLWNRFKWLFKMIINFKKKSYPLINYGTKMILGSFVAMGGSFNITVVLKVSPEDKLFNQFDITFSNIEGIVFILGVIAFLIGFFLIIFGIKAIQNNARETARVLIISMLGESAQFPIEILSESEKIDIRETIKLGLIERSDYVQKSIEMFNAERLVDIYHRFILHGDCKKVLIGGRARVPFLVAYGSCFKSISAEIEYFDQFHKDGKWVFLDDENENITLIYQDINILIPNNNGNIGIALGLTTSIEKHQLPDYIQDHTLFISPAISVGRNLIKNSENLQQISSEVKMIIDQLSAKENCCFIHLFLSVQSTLAIELGRNYQEGTHKNWIIHNFDASVGRYEWAIQLTTNGKIEKL